MAEYYISANSGNDGNDGSIDRPFRSIDHAANVMSGGDTMWIRGGTYDIFGVRLPAGSSWGSPTYVKAYPGEQAIIQPTESTLFIQAFDLGITGYGTSYVVFDGLIFDGSLQYIGSIVKITPPSHHIRHIRCEFKNLAGGAVQLGHGLDSDYGFNEFISCHLHHGGRYAQGANTTSLGTVLVPQGTGTGHCFYIGSSDNLVEFCDIHDWGEYGVHNYTGGHNSDGSIESSNRNVYRYNRVFRCNLDTTRFGQRNGCGILVGSGEDHVVYRNIIYGCDQGIAAGAGKGAFNCRIYYNTIYGNNSGMNFSGSTGADVRGNIIRNNAYGVDVYDFGTSTNYANNIDSSGPDPLMIDPDNGEFGLQAGSPAIDAGPIISGISYSGSAPDLGALEFPDGTDTIGLGGTPSPTTDAPPPSPVPPAPPPQPPPSGGGGGSVGEGGGSGGVGVDPGFPPVIIPPDPTTGTATDGSGLGEVFLEIEYGGSIIAAIPVDILANNGSFIKALISAKGASSQVGHIWNPESAANVGYGAALVNSEVDQILKIILRASSARALLSDDFVQLRTALVLWLHTDASTGGIYVSFAELEAPETGIFVSFVELETSADSSLFASFAELELPETGLFVSFEELETPETGLFVSQAELQIGEEEQAVITQQVARLSFPIRGPGRS